MNTTPLIIEAGICYDGKFVPWSIILESVTQVTDVKIKEKIEKGINKQISWNNLNGNILGNLDDIGEQVGVKPGRNFEKRIRAKIKKLNMEEQ